MERLAEALRLLRQETRQGQPPQQTRQVVLDAARLAGRAHARGLESYADAMVTQLRTAASDLLRASGQADVRGRAAAGRPPTTLGLAGGNGLQGASGCRPRLFGVAFWL